MAMGQYPKCRCPLWIQSSPLWIQSSHSWHQSTLRRIRTFRGLTEVDRIIIHHSNVNLMFLNKHNIFILYFTILFSCGSP